MILINIVIFVALVAIIGTLVQFALQDQGIGCCNNGCTGDCNQGRNCTCRGDKPDTNPNWPFPVERP